MKSLLANVGLPKAIGLYVDDDVVYLSQIVGTPFGPVEVARDSERGGPDELTATTQRLVRRLFGRRGVGRMPVAVGLPGGRTYFSTRPIQNASSDPSPHVLLRESLRSSRLSVNDMVVDVVKTRLDKRLVASIVSCDKQYVTGLLDSLEQCNIRPCLAEPAPCALLRSAVKRRSAARGDKVVVRLFLHDAQGLAVLAVNDMPVVWRSFTLDPSDEASAMLSVSRTLVTVRKDCGIESALDAVIVHGRADLARLMDTDWVQAELEAPVQWLDGPSLEGPQVAFGLALAGLNEDARSFDLAQTLRPQSSLWELLPLREAVLQTALLLAAALFLADRCYSLEGSYASVAADTAQYPWLALTEESQIENEKRELTAKAAAVNKFLKNRITWTSYGRELASCLPTNVFLTSFEGASEMGTAATKRGKAKPKKSLVLRGAVSVSPDGSIPKEIDRFLDTLREHPKLKEDFPIVELTDLKQPPCVGDENSVAFFTVVCTPKQGKGAAPP
ncbi:MAG: hypothetical protein HQ567_30440 [Candidatus Nealsonbacteria bacterium]|nr:hypothetical protein [Candidatus Nealsonbacteria bacterium]